MSILVKFVVSWTYLATHYIIGSSINV